MLNGSVVRHARKRPVGSEETLSALQRSSAEGEYRWGKGIVGDLASFASVPFELASLLFVWRIHFCLSLSSRSFAFLISAISAIRWEPHHAPQALYSTEPPQE